MSLTFTKYRIVQRRGKCHKHRKEDSKGKNLTGKTFSNEKKKEMDRKVKDSTMTELKKKEKRVKK